MLTITKDTPHRSLVAKAVQSNIAKDTAFEFQYSPAGPGKAAIVRHQNGGEITASAQGIQQRENFFSCRFIQIAGWLVGQQEGGIGNERARDGHALLFAAGKFSGTVVRSVGEPHFIQPFLRHRQRFHPVFSPDQFRHHHIFGTGEFGEQVMLLPNVPDLTIAEYGDFRIGQRGDISAAEANGAAGGPVEAGNQIQQRAFSCAAFPHHGKLFTLLHFEFEIAKYHDLVLA